MKDNYHKQSRRNFLNRTLGVAGGLAAATLVAPSRTLAAYEMYTESEYWSEEDVEWWEGRRVGGFPIGVIQLSANIPMIPGNMGNATTFGFPLLFERNPEISAILLECTELPPHARAIQKAVARPVWGFPTMVNWIYQGVVRRNFKGFV